MNDWSEHWCPWLEMQHNHLIRSNCEQIVGISVWEVITICQINNGWDSGTHNYLEILSFVSNFKFAVDGLMNNSKNLVQPRWKSM